jgi:type IV secretory pathway VirB4 component
MDTKNTPTSDLKQDFILELMVFSPKYNAVTAEVIASQLTEPEMQEYLEKLRKINEKDAEDLANLQESNPEEYARLMKERQDAEEEADDEFYKEIEQEVEKEVDEVDEMYTKAEDEVTKAAEKTEEKIDKAYKRAEDLLKAFLDDIDEAAPEVQETQQEPQKPEMNLAQVQNELRQMVDQDQFQPTTPPSPVPPIDHAVEEKNPNNWQ